MMSYTRILSSNIVNIKDDHELNIVTLTIPTDEEQEYQEELQNKLNNLIKKITASDIYNFFEERNMVFRVHEVDILEIKLMYLIEYLRTKLQIHNTNFDIELMT